MGVNDAERQVIQLPIEPGLVCLRGLSPKRLRFEVEYGLERGTSANSFLFTAGTTATGQPVPPVLVHPPGNPLPPRSWSSWPGWCRPRRP